jgi:sarcosine oxidase
MIPEKRIAIVGAGVFGSWISLMAVRAGFETILIDSHPPGNALSSSGGLSRILRRAYGADEIYSRFAERSRKLWLEFFDKENRADCFRRTGVLWIANNTNSSILAARQILERYESAPVFLDTAAIRQSWPGMNVPGTAVALFEADCGALLAEKSVRAVVAAAVREGARHLEGKAGAPPSVMAGGQPIDADIFVYACGSWLSKLFPDVLGDRIFPTRQEIFYFEPPPGAASLPVWVDETDERVPYGFPNIDGAGIKVAFHRPGPAFDPDSGSRVITNKQVAEAAEYLSRRLPEMRMPVCKGTQVCHYENTSSGDFLIDRHPSMTNVWFTGGGSGHGFKHGPAVAEYLLQAIQRDESPEPRFRLATKGRQLAKSVI